MKKLLAIVLVVTLMVSAVPMGAFTLTASAEDTTYTEGYYTYTVSDGKATITYVNGLISGDVVIPDTLGGYTVTKIGEWSFSYCENITGITIPDSVTSIEFRSFDGCTGLAYVDIPNSVTSIDALAFRYCTNLTGITIPDSVTKIGYDAISDTAYYNDPNNWQDGVLYIGNHLIGVNDTINDDYIVKDGTLTIADYAFSRCRSLVSITLPNSIKNISEYAFSYCSSLKNIIIPNSVATIEEYAFLGCSSLVNITLPDSVTNIGEYAFSSCSSLKNIAIPYGVTYINNGMFSSCDSLASVTMPNSVTSIGKSAFWSCNSLTSITIPDSVTSIGESAFNFCQKLSSVVFGNGVTSIGNDAFWDCDSLTNLTLPDSITSLGEGSFRDCDRLTSITIPDSITSIGELCFYLCDSLTNITIPDSVTNIGSMAFCCCPNLTNITIDENNNYYCVIDGVLFNKDITKLMQYFGGKSDTSYVIPNTVTSIDDGAFYGCYNLTNITIPDGVISIGESAFFGCEGLTSIIIPDGVASIGRDAFWQCDNLANISIPDSVISMGAFAFYDTAYYEDKNNWQDGFLYVGNHLISADKSITNAYVKEGTITISNAFNSCYNLTSVIIPDSVKSIGDRTFVDCSSLISVKMSNSIISIGDSAFWGCGKLKSINIPNSVTSIGESAFYSCYRLTDVWYTGSEEDKEKINIGSDNDYLLNATWHYNTCTNEHVFSGEVSLKCDKCDYVRSISEIIERLEINDISLIENVNINNRTQYNPETGNWDLEWKEYYYYPTWKVILKDGSVLESKDGNGFYYHDQYLSIDISDNQSYENQWGVGEHTVVGSLLDFTDEFTVKIDENPIERIVLNKAPDREYIYGDIEFGHSYGDTQYWLYPNDLTGISFTVYYKDGTTKTYDQTDIKDNYYIDGFALDIPTVSCTPDMTSANATFSYIGHTVEYSVVLKESPVASIEMTKSPDITEVYDYYHSDFIGAEFTITYANGSTKVVNVTDSNVEYIDEYEKGGLTYKIDVDGYKLIITSNDPMYIERYYYASYLGKSCRVWDWIYKDGKIAESIDVKDVSYNGKGMTAHITYTDGNEETVEFNDIVYTDYRDVWGESAVSGYVKTSKGFLAYSIVLENETDEDIQYTVYILGQSVTVKAPQIDNEIIVGDTNGDSAINNKDLGLLMQHLNGWDVEINTDAADVNGDGSVNNKDYGLLMQYCNGWEVELK